ncbi:MAG: membrane protein insertion efficiency factor YidD [Candidatus Eisenbacteria bacterium]|nr:membrane protein insertion efficiency factor YidD [Candidatus Eisenbacteria bacterium]
MHRVTRGSCDHTAIGSWTPSGVAPPRHAWRATVEWGIARALMLLIDLYRSLASPWIGPSCRFAPSCSQYARTALQRHGLLRGGRLALGRLLRCHPWRPGGYDPVP